MCYMSCINFMMLDDFMLLALNKMIIWHGWLMCITLLMSIIRIVSKGIICSFFW